MICPGFFLKLEGTQGGSHLPFGFGFVWVEEVEVAPPSCGHFFVAMAPWAHSRVVLAVRKGAPAGRGRGALIGE